MTFMCRLPILFAVAIMFVTSPVVTGSSGAQTQHKPERGWDMRQYGYSSAARDYSAVGFLSENLLLVAINQAPDDSNSHPLFEEKPDATLVLLSVADEQALRVTHMPMFKFDDSMAPALEGDFLLLTLSEVKLCSVDFHCDRTFPTKGPFYLSRDRFKVVVGGHLRTPKVVLDSRTLVPVSGEAPKTIEGAWEKQYRPDRSYIESISSLNGARVMTVETRQTRWSKITNPLAGFGDPPFNNRILKIYDKQTGREKFTLQWDPRHDWGGTAKEPALSPTGHRVAVLHGGVVEVFEVP